MIGLIDLENAKMSNDRSKAAMKPITPPNRKNFHIVIQELVNSIRTPKMVLSNIQSSPILANKRPYPINGMVENKSKKNVIAWSDDKGFYAIPPNKETSRWDDVDYIRDAQGNWHQVSAGIHTTTINSDGTISHGDSVNKTEKEILGYEVDKLPQKVKDLNKEITALTEKVKKLEKEGKSSPNTKDLDKLKKELTKKKNSLEAAKLMLVDRKLGKI